jgi:hypothetical protein
VCFCRPIKSHFHFAFNTQKLKFGAGLYFRTNSLEFYKGTRCVSPIQFCSRI